MANDLLHRIIYTSDSLVENSDISEELAKIQTTAQTRNYADDVTGLLLFSDNRFLQILEGNEDKLRSIMQDIHNDKRHQNIFYVADRPIRARTYASWSMEVCNLHEPIECQDKLRKIRMTLFVYMCKYGKRIEDYYYQLPPPRV